MGGEESTRVRRTFTPWFKKDAVRVGGVGWEERNGGGERSRHRLSIFLVKESVLPKQCFSFAKRLSEELLERVVRV